MQAALDAYYTTLSQFHTLDVRREQSVRHAMQVLLAEAAREAHWTLIAEEPLPNGKRPDATFFDDYRMRRGYWEAKDTQDDLATEITKKFNLGYSADNIVTDPNRPDDAEYVVRLIEQVVHISLETVRLVKGLRPTPSG